MAIAKCGMIASLMDEIAPRRLAEDWDNVGLIIGNGGQEVKKLMVALDLPIWVLEEAIDKNVDMVITHHPFIFKGIKKINTDTNLGRKIIKLIEKGISVYSSHTNFDMARDGLNDIFANQLGLKEFEIIKPSKEEKLYKLVVYTPFESKDKILQSLYKAGAGCIGNYSESSFRVEGIGTFKPQEGSNPYIGKQGKLEEIKELRIETIVPENKLKRVIRKMMKVHPYEEPVYDIYELKNQGFINGIGRIGDLDEETSIESYARYIKEILGLKSIRYAKASSNMIKKVALVNGSGNKFAEQARFLGADVLVTGDMQYHQIIDALEDGLSIIDAGHFGTEKIMIKTIADYLGTSLKELKYDLEIIESQSNMDPIISI